MGSTNKDGVADDGTIEGRTGKVSIGKGNTATHGCKADGGTANIGAAKGGTTNGDMVMACTSNYDVVKWERQKDV